MPYTGWTGSDCASVDACYSSPCQNGAQCHSEQDIYICSCPPGFTGQLVVHSILRTRLYAVVLKINTAMHRTYTNQRRIWDIRDGRSATVGWPRFQRVSWVQPTCIIILSFFMYSLKPLLSTIAIATTLVFLSNRPIFPAITPKNWDPYILPNC